MGSIQDEHQISNLIKHIINVKCKIKMKSKNLYQFRKTQIEELFWQQLMKACENLQVHARLENNQYNSKEVENG